jgi:hypothetical protein
MFTNMSRKIGIFFVLHSTTDSDVPRLSEMHPSMFCLCLGHLALSARGVVAGALSLDNPRDTV